MLQLLIYGIGYSLILFTIILLAKNNRNLTDVILAIWLFFASTIYIRHDYKWEICMSFCHCVFLFIYIKSILNGAKFHKKWLLHLAPFLIVTLITVFRPGLLFRSVFFVYALVIPFISIYFYLSLKLIFDYKNQSKKISSAYSVNIEWLLGVAGITIFSHLLPIAQFLLFGNKYFEIVELITLIGLTLIGVKALRLNFSFFGTEKLESKENKQSYSTYTLKEADVDRMEQKLLLIMETQKPYLTPDLMLKDLAHSLDIAPHHLSFLLNIRFNRNFYEFINNYRLEAVKQELINPENKHLSIAAIAYDCGFNSQSTFNRFFKQKTGISPSQYLNNANL